jgi:ATP-binding cassette subfamily B protein
MDRACRPSGSGNSTLISLLLRLYDPSAGRLLIDGGEDARDYRLSELRSQMSMVTQEMLLFGGSIFDAIGRHARQPAAIP